MAVKLLYSYFKIPWSVLHFEWIFYKHRLLFHNALATWKVLIHWGMLDFQIIMYFIWWYWAGPCRTSRQKPFCVPHFFEYRKQPSFSLYDLPTPSSSGQIQAVLIRKRRDVRPGRKKRSRAALGQVPVSPSVDTHSNIFEMFNRYRNPSRGRSESESEVTQTVARQAPLSMGFSRQ